MKNAKLVADAVNQKMQKPKRIEFEKVYSTMLLLSKKRYGGLLFAENHKWGTEPPVDIKGAVPIQLLICSVLF